MEGELKRRILALIEEIEIDAEGRVVVCEAVPEVVETPSVVEPEIVAVEEVAEEALQEVAATETEPVEEVVYAEAETTETETAQAPAVEAINVAAAIGDVPAPKYVNKNFAQKMMLADEVIQDRYDEVKNYALRFKKLKARISKKFESINQGRLQFVKLSVAGKTLKLYLNMDVSETDPKFRCKDMSDKVTYETVPTMLRIKSGRAVRYAKILIDQCAAKYGLVENKKFQEVDAMKVVEDFLAEREAKKQAKLNGGAVDTEEADYDVDAEALEEIAVAVDEAALDAIEEVDFTEEAVEETQEEVVEEATEIEE